MVYYHNSIASRSSSYGSGTVAHHTGFLVALCPKLSVIPLEYMIPSGKHTKNYGESPLLMGKSIISMTIFNSYVKLSEGSGCWIGVPMVDNDSPE